MTRAITPGGRQAEASAPILVSIGRRRGSANPRAGVFASPAASGYWVSSTVKAVLELGS